MRSGRRALRLALAGTGAMALASGGAPEVVATEAGEHAIAVTFEIAVPRVAAGYVPPRALRERERRSVGDIEVLAVLPNGTAVSTRTDARGAVSVPAGWIGAELLLIARTPRKAAMSVDDCPFTGCPTGRNLWAASVTLTEEIVADGQIVVPADSPAAGAFAILEAAAEASATAWVAGVEPAAPIGFRWMPESTTSCATTCFVAGNVPHIPVLGLSSDSDHFDRQIVMHEYGHFVEYQLAGRSGEGGYHDGTPTSPALAFSEGFATWFAVVASGDVTYVDSHRAGAAWYSYDAITARAGESAGIDQPLSEDLVVELLLRLAPPGDPAAQARILTALRDAHASSDDCGAPGIDLADVLERLGSGGDADMIEEAALRHGVPFVSGACVRASRPASVKPDALPHQSPITPAQVSVECDAESGLLGVEVAARAQLDDATVILRRVNARGEIDAATIHEVGAIDAGDGWRVELRGGWREGLVAARLDWFLPGGSRGATVATASCNLPDPGAWDWQPSEIRTMPDGSRLRVSAARGLR